MIYGFGYFKSEYIEASDFVSSLNSEGIFPKNIHNCSSPSIYSFTLVCPTQVKDDSGKVSMQGSIIPYLLALPPLSLSDHYLIFIFFPLFLSRVLREPDLLQST
jgi:hypothetical protein